MDNRLLLVKSLTLIYRESQLSIKTENSADLVRTAIETVQIPDFTNGINSEREILLNLKATIIEMCSNPPDHEYDKNSLLQQLKINCKHDENFYNILAEGINEEIQDNQLKRNIVNLRKAINNHFREEKINEVLNKASYDFKFKRDKIKDINQFLMETVAQLDALQVQSSSKDPALIADLDISDENAVKEVCKELLSNNDSAGILKTGWQDINLMLQGGFRRGDYVITPSLQHKYKTGTNLSYFAQVAQFNIPHMIDKTKKPLLLRISCEDKMIENVQFLYQYLKYDETLEFVDIKEASIEEMSLYIKEKLTINGYHIKLKQIDPTQSSYKHICNIVIELEAQGYEIHLIAIDQVGMLPTTGCVSTGPMGTEKRDIIRRLRNFCLPKKITLITPHQLSTDAKMLIRNGLPEDKFLADIAEKGFYEGSKQLDQEVDLEIYGHLFKYKGKTYMNYYRGKHRISTILPDEYRSVYFEFPKGMPIPSDINREKKISFRKLPAGPSNAEASLFEF